MTTTDSTIRSAPADQPIYTVPEAAAWARMSERQMWNLVRSGDIKSVKVGRLRRITRQALTDLIAS